MIGVAKKDLTLPNHFTDINNFFSGSFREAPIKIYEKKVRRLSKRSILTVMRWEGWRLVSRLK